VYSGKKPDMRGVRIFGTDVQFKDNFDHKGKIADRVEMDY